MPNKMRILMLENVSADAEMNIRALRTEGLDFEFKVVSNRKEFEKELSEYKPDIILADYNLPDFNGVDALRMVKEWKVAAPVIVVTGSLDEETAVDTIKEGAADYVIKQHLVRLGPAVRSALEKSRMAEEKESAQQALSDAYRELEQKVRQRTEALERSEKEYRDLVENVNSIILSIDHDGNIVFMNDFGLRFFGVSPEEVVGRNVLGTILPETDSEGRDMRQMLDAIMSDPHNHQLNVNENIKKNGERVLVSWTNRAIHDEQGRILGVFSVGSDVTELKRAETALQESEEKYRTLVERANDGIIIVQDGTVMYANPKMAELDRSSTGEIIGTHFTDHVDPRDLRKLAEVYRRRMAGEKVPVPYEALLRRKDGSTAQAEINAALITYQGKPADMVIIRDITERKKVEEAMRESEERFRTMADNISQLAWMAEVNGALFWYNKRWYDYTGTTFQEMEGWGWQKVHHPGYVAKVTEKYRHNIASGEPWEDTFPIRGSDGEYHWFLSRAIPIRDAQGAIIRWFGTNTDITQLRETQRLLSDALKEARQRADEAEEGRRKLEALMEYIPEGVMLFDAPDVKVTMVSSYMGNALGRPREALLGNNAEQLRNLWQPFNAQGGMQLQVEDLIVSRVAKGMSIMDEESVLKRADGTLVTVAVNAGPIRDKEGKITGGVLSWRDISERRRAEDALRRNEYELRTLVDNSPDLIIRLNRQLQYIYVNPSYERITGITREQFAGKTNNELGMPQRMVDFWQSALKPVLETGREQSVEFDIDSFFGRRHFFARIIPEYAKTGVVETVLVISHDITERKRAEEQIRYISFHDKVTGLFNRSFFEEEVRRVDVERELPVCIIMGDVNYLKMTNDVFGHDEGDILLKAIADIFRNACRKSDIIARWGGDEFAVILPQTSFSVADKVCGRVTLLTRESKGSAIQPSISLGVAAKERKDQNIYQVIRQAEERMYQNKFEESGRNEARVFEALFRRIRERNPDMESHLERTGALVEKFSEKLGLSESQRHNLRLLVKFHDIGCAEITQEVMVKPGRLTPQEWEVMKKHAEAGFRIVKTFSDTAVVSDEVLSHDERWDGAGYPRGLKGQDIPYLARVFAVADVYDIITHHRFYARTFTPQEALEELRRNAGTQFDPQLVDAFIAMAEEAKPALSRA